jgi:hypothetical protein
MDSYQPAAFRESKVYDETRRGRDWMSLLTPTQCAVFFKDFQTAAPLSHDGVAFDRMTNCTFLVFDRLEDARRFCELQVAQHPSLCCEIFDFEGRAKPPLLVVVHPSVAEKDELSTTWVRRRKYIAITSFLCAIPLIVWDWRTGEYLILPTVVGVNLILLGLRLLYWNTARSDNAPERLRRLESHRQREAESDGKLD